MRLIVLVAAILCFTQMSCPLQSIPGRIECEIYSSYHDSDSINNGSGKLNPADGNPLNEFRMNEGVDISYTKEKNIDNSIYNKVKPEMGSLYVGWTVPGEWTTYRISVKKSGTYIVSAMYTAHDDGSVLLELKDTRKILNIPSTYDPADTIAWRQWHHWNKIDLGEIDLKKGSQAFKLQIQTSGNMNFDYLEFRRKN